MSNEARGTRRRIISGEDLERQTLTGGAQEFVAANIVIIGASVVAFGLLMAWGRAVRGSWPGRTKRLVFIAIIVANALADNILYLYFRSH